MLSVRHWNEWVICPLQCTNYIIIYIPAFSWPCCCAVCLHSLSAQFACTVACTVCQVTVSAHSLCLHSLPAQCVGAPLHLFPPCSSEPTYLYGLLKSLCIEHCTQHPAQPDILQKPLYAILKSCSPNSMTMRMWCTCADANVV